MSVYNENAHGAKTFGTQDSGTNRVSGEEETPQVHFDAMLYPNRSLSVKGFQIILAIFGLYGLLMGSLFIAQGAWLVPWFYGAEIAFVIWLFLQSYKSGRDHETIRLTDTDLIIEEYSNRQGQKSWVFEPSWTRVELDQLDEDRNRLRVMCRGDGVVIGEFLTNDERQDFADNLRRALSVWKESLIYR